MRERGYAPIERLAARVAGENGTIDERIRGLSVSDAKRSIADLFELGWID